MLLLTGGTGYIGSHVAVEFINAGYEIVIIDNLSNSSQQTINAIEEITGIKPKFYKGDIRNKSDLEVIFKDNDITGVVHFAGAKAVGESCDDPFYYYQNNIVGTLNILEVMDVHNVKDMVFSSSANVYGPEGISPFSEEHLVGNTSNPYGTTKFIIERLLRDLSFHKSFNVINLRYFNPVGAHESGLIGEHANQKLGNILPFLLKVADGKQDHIEIYGDDYDTIDGSGVRDYIHVVDLAKGHVDALKHIKNNSDDPTLECINLGTGRGTSVLELLEMTREVTGEEVPHKIVGRREIDIAIAYCNPDKAKTIIGWEAKMTVRQAVKDSWNFIQKNK